MTTKYLLFLLPFLFVLNGFTQSAIIRVNQLTTNSIQFEKTEFDIDLITGFTNPFDSKEIALDMLITSPAGKTLALPCYFDSGNSAASKWKARFAAQENGTYQYHFTLTKNLVIVETSTDYSLNVTPSAGNGFLHKNPNSTWSFLFDSGNSFRGIGENVAWESRSWENATYTYDLFLKELADNGANFFRTWMCPWNLPLEWKKVVDTKRYTNSTEYFHPGGIKRMDELVEKAESLGMYMMLALDWHGAVMNSDRWAQNNYNMANGGPIATPAEFFTSTLAKDKYKNRLRYLVARWGYSTSIGAWEFFNEIDNASYATPTIPDADIKNWHSEMSTYLSQIDPYHHLITTSVSHRDISGMAALPHLDFNQRHVYNNTGGISSTIKSYTASTGKPYVIGEFGYDWDWNNVNEANGPNFDFDLKRGMWYGLFTPTPILPMAWWWEFSHERNMIPYFRGIKMISDRMNSAGNGSITAATVSAGSFESYAVKCGTSYFIYLLNNTASNASQTIALTVSSNISYAIQSFNPADLRYTGLNAITASGGKLSIPAVNLNSKKEIVFIVTPSGTSVGETTPYKNRIALPGTLEAEDFDNGGENIAWHDADPSNLDGAYRAEVGVDIESAGDGINCISHIVTGEWIKYSVNVSKSGSYNMEAKVQSNGTGGSFHLELDGLPVTASVNIPDTGGQWQTVSASIIPVIAGDKTLRLVMDAGDFKIDQLQFSLVNQAPLVSLTSPDNGTAASWPTTFTLKADASDADGSVARVEYYNGNLKIGTSTAPPFEIQWTPAVGNIELTAKAIDDKGLATLSAPIGITVTALKVQTPYETNPYTIPGKIEAENFDKGVEGIAYHELTAGNKFNVYRSEDVDVEACTDAGGGYNLGDMQLNEWVEYTVNVTDAGLYTLEFRVATQMAGTKFHLELDGVNITGSLAVPNTGGWQIWQTLKKENVQMTVGKKVLRLVIEGEYFNLNHLNFILTQPTAIEVRPENGIKFYPNPVKDILLIESSYGKDSRLIVTNLFGQEVFQTELNSQSVDLSSLPKGFYMATLMDRSNIKLGIFKFVKE